MKQLATSRFLGSVVAFVTEVQSMLICVRLTCALCCSRSATQLLNLVISGLEVQADGLSAQVVNM